MKLSIASDGIVNEQELYSDNNSTQQYVRTAVHTTVKELGRKVSEEWEMDDDSIEVTIEEELLEEFDHTSEGC
tara:strand:+ start:180 stop:398 length:219 start_codon:yes stop_codon:yes gene_type:complete